MGTVAASSQGITNDGDAALDHSANGVEGEVPEKQNTPQSAQRQTVENEPATETIETAEKSLPNVCGEVVRVREEDGGASEIPPTPDVKRETQTVTEGAAEMTPVAVETQENPPVVGETPEMTPAASEPQENPPVVGEAAEMTPVAGEPQENPPVVREATDEQSEQDKDPPETQVDDDDDDEWVIEEFEEVYHSPVNGPPFVAHPPGYGGPPVPTPTDLASPNSDLPPGAILSDDGNPMLSLDGDDTVLTENPSACADPDGAVSQADAPLSASTTDPAGQPDVPQTGSDTAHLDQLPNINTSPVSDEKSKQAGAKCDDSANLTPRSAAEAQVQPTHDQASLPLNPRDHEIPAEVTSAENPKERVKTDSFFGSDYEMLKEIRECVAKRELEEAAAAAKVAAEAARKQQAKAASDAVGSKPGKVGQGSAAAGVKDEVVTVEDIADRLKSIRQEMEDFQKRESVRAVERGPSAAGKKPASLAEMKAYVKELRAALNKVNSKSGADHQPGNDAQDETSANTENGSKRAEAENPKEQVEPATDEQAGAAAQSGECGGGGAPADSAVLSPVPDAVLQQTGSDEGVTQPAEPHVRVKPEPQQGDEVSEDEFFESDWSVGETPKANDSPAPEETPVVAPELESIPTPVRVEHVAMTDDRSRKNNVRIELVEGNEEETFSMALESVPNATKLLKQPNKEVIVNFVPISQTSLNQPQRNPAVSKTDSSHPRNVSTNVKVVTNDNEDDTRAKIPFTMYNKLLLLRGELARMQMEVDKLKSSMKKVNSTLGELLDSSDVGSYI